METKLAVWEPGVKADMGLEVWNIMEVVVKPAE
jgi:hypothetical protein